jgi:acyl-CoA dehydrogenase
MLLRDGQVLSIWEGTTNVLSLDVLRAMNKGDGLRCLTEEVAELTSALTDPRLAEVGRRCRGAVAHAAGHTAALLDRLNGSADAAGDAGRAIFSAAFGAMEASARRLSLTLGRSLAGALLARHAEWSLAHEGDGRARAAACRFAAHGVDLLDLEAPLDESLALAGDAPLAP